MNHEVPLSLMGTNALEDTGRSNQGLCDNLEGRWKEVQGGGDRGTPMAIHFDVWQKPTQYCKAIILQLKINKFNFKKI